MLNGIINYHLNHFEIYLITRLSNPPTIPALTLNPPCRKTSLYRTEWGLVCKPAECSVHILDTFMVGKGTNFQQQGILYNQPLLFFLAPEHATVAQCFALNANGYKSAMIKKSWHLFWQTKPQARCNHTTSSCRAGYSVLCKQ